MFGFYFGGGGVKKAFCGRALYKGTERDLLRELDDLFSPIPEEDRKDVVGALVPHAGYVYSGKVAGAVYSRIKQKQTFVIVGPDHAGRGNDFSLSLENWGTPIGDVEVDIELAEEIMKKERIVRNNPLAHQREHSIEVQLPFIKNFFQSTKIVPICVSSEHVKELESVAKSIVFSARSLGRDIAVLASSDMTHYEDRDSATVKDREAIEAILALDAERLIKANLFNDISMCGLGPSVMMIFAALELQANMAELVMYSDSGEVTGNIDEVVGYAGIIASRMKEKE